MIKVVLYSEDRTLHPLLSSALGREFNLLQKPDEESIKELVMAERCDVLILDVYSNRDTVEKSVESFRRLISLGVPAVIMADEALYSKVREFVNQEAFGYCRRPPSI